ncbi:hypothetical protein BGZ51_008352 [Haplosporangium sp. Z 767]|nr:hypothetical protein BGZ51_008352 [Haplosporangium sp. Z 767]
MPFERKKLGKNPDDLLRIPSARRVNLATIEAAPVCDPAGTKFLPKSHYRVARQLYDMLRNRLKEIEKPENKRDFTVMGIVQSGPATLTSRMDIPRRYVVRDVESPTLATPANKEQFLASLDSLY